MVSCKSWAILDVDTGKLIAGKNENNRREIASLTKMMTIWVFTKFLKISKISSRPKICISNA